MIETDIRQLNERIQLESQFIDLINMEMIKEFQLEVNLIVQEMNLTMLLSMKISTLIQTPNTSN